MIFENSPCIPFDDSVNGGIASSKILLSITLQSIYSASDWKSSSGEIVVPCSTCMIWSIFIFNSFKARGASKQLHGNLSTTLIKRFWSCGSAMSAQTLIAVPIKQPYVGQMALRSKLGISLWMTRSKFGAERRPGNQVLPRRVRPHCWTRMLNWPKAVPRRRLHLPVAMNSTRSIGDLSQKRRPHLWDQAPMLQPRSWISPAVTKRITGPSNLAGGIHIGLSRRTGRYR